MSIERFQLLRNVGQFDSVNAGTHLPLARFALVYAENGRGKTTLAAIFRSAATGNATLVTERRRLGSQHEPHVVIQETGALLQFQNGAWSTAQPAIAVFDDQFVAQNICSGIEIEAGHRQHLHELILGSLGGALNATVKRHVARIEEHNTALRTLGEAIPAAARGLLSIDAFCSLEARADIDDAITEAERELAAAQSAEAIRQAPAFAVLTLPSFDLAAINALLSRTLQDLEAAAAGEVQAHLAKLGRGGDAWVSEGMSHIETVSAGKDRDICPFCAQDLGGSPLLRHYQAYFSLAYGALKKEIAASIQSINTAHGDPSALAFERSVGEAQRSRSFWAPFLAVPEINLDSAALTLAWSTARDAVAMALAAKQAAPLESARLSAEAVAVIANYEAAREAVAACSESLQGRNAEVAAVKTRAAIANVGALTIAMTRLKAIRARHTAPVLQQCDDYVAEKRAKAVTEGLRDTARQALDNYRRNIFVQYQTAINTYLGRFNAGFRLAGVDSVNNRSGSSATYSVLINNQAVPLTAEHGPSFRNTLSAGDRNALALAFFFASLDQDPHLGQKVVVIDDPMTSLDEHRSLTTVQEMRRLLARVAQVIVLSHSKPFLCELWEGANPADRSAMMVARAAAGSTLIAWDVRLDCITEHDKRHELVSGYLQVSNPANERQVAAALRHILEAFARVAYPTAFQPGSLLGPFIHHCQQHLGLPTQILSPADVTELRALLDYANLFHHDSNPAYATQAINDQELTGFARRTLAFARRA